MSSDHIHLALAPIKNFAHVGLHGFIMENEPDPIDGNTTEVLPVWVMIISGIVWKQV
jgi:hypothetical protein